MWPLSSLGPWEIRELSEGQILLCEKLNLTLQKKPKKKPKHCSYKEHVYMKNSTKTEI